ncbi:MAG: MBL fold metallo-hydrolase [Bacteroidales bacterium]|nr:MBL fold metallo-hydrolase [Bacteroidales bacterium]
MKRKVCCLFFILNLSYFAWAQTVEKGPYTVYVIGEGVYHIEDANSSRPAGLKTDSDGKIVDMNNSSDIYLIVGTKKALLVDLSNFIKWDSTAVESLRSVVSERVGNKEFYITFTHNHGDHTGMLPAFRDDPKVKFWIPEAEFKTMDLFPKERTIFFSENGSLDLGGGYMISTTEVPGHTGHGTLFFIKGMDIVFTGDALGSGNGVWLFNYESFITYARSIDNLISYLENPANKINLEKLVIYGGHYWQRGKQEELTARYVYDMRTLIEKMRQGTAEATPMPSQMRYLDTNFKYGTATITWNKKDAGKYSLEHSIK